MVIAIDGPAASGKSTVARIVAKRAGLTYINSGNFYRAITYAVLAHDLDPENPQDVVRVARESKIGVVEGELHLDGNNIDSRLHSDSIDRWVAGHSAIPEVRDVVNEQLRRAVRNLDAIIEGRDIATVVFPDAAVKIYLDASIQVRALRRLHQGVSSLTLAELERSIEARDTIDRNKPTGSLRRTEDAFYLDTSDLTIEEVCEKVVEKIRKNNLGSQHPGSRGEEWQKESR